MVTRLLLVHSPLAGRETWDLVAAELTGRGYPVAVPDLTGTVSSGPPYCVRQAEVIARGAAGQPAVLIGRASGPRPRDGRRPGLAAALAAVVGR